MADIAFSPELVVMLDDVQSYQEAEAALANHLVKLGYAKKSFPSAIAEREESFPTGLQIGEFNAAMPHCDSENVNRAAICVGVIKNPVSWKRMDDPDETCNVGFITMLALTEAHSHLEMLQRVVALIQDQELMSKIASVSSPQEVFDLVGSKLNQ